MCIDKFILPKHFHKHPKCQHGFQAKIHTSAPIFLSCNFHNRDLTKFGSISSEVYYKITTWRLGSSITLLLSSPFIKITAGSTQQIFLLSHSGKFEFWRLNSRYVARSARISQLSTKSRAIVDSCQILTDKASRAWKATTLLGRIDIQHKFKMKTLIWTFLIISSIQIANSDVNGGKGCAGKFINYTQVNFNWTLLVTLSIQRMHST